MQNKEIEKIYNDFVNNNFIKFDSKQIDILQKLVVTYNNYRKIRIFSKNKKNIGVYVYGSVGIGKTFVLNLFTQNIKNSKKIHFNHFMINLHAHINNNKNSLALEAYIKNYAKSFSLIFIDELHIFNIVDALLIKRIFNFFKKYKVFIIVSSNFHPDELYKNGLQRNDFLPFIEFVKKTYKVIHLHNMTDYRRLMLNQSKTYFSPINDETSLEFNKLFEKFVDRGEIHIRKIKTKSRLIRFEKCTSNIVFISFDDLCNKNLAHEDYHNIAKTFKLLFINKVPLFTNSLSDQCRRFISLIDMLYDQQCSVVILAEKSVNKLCEVKNLQKEFNRTVSRLYEMTIINTNKNEK